MSAIEVDTTRLPLLLQELRLPAITRLWSEFTERADKEGWPAARLLSALAELEIAERGRRRQPARGERVVPGIGVVMNAHIGAIVRFSRKRIIDWIVVQSQKARVCIRESGSQRMRWRTETF